MLTSVLYGTESMTIFKDQFGLEQQEIVDLTTWGAQLMIRQAQRQEQEQEQEQEKS